MAIPTPEESGSAALSARDECKQMLAEAEARRDARMASKCRSELRKWDKMIADFGLERYAHRT